MRLLIFAGLFISATAYGANTNFEAYDLKKCERWSITDEVDVDSAGYKDAIRIEKLQKNSRSNFKKHDLSTSEYQSLARVFSAFRFLDKAQKNFINKFGVCTYKGNEKSAQFSCIPSPDFPFSGATFSGASKNADKRHESLMALKCVSGCLNLSSSIIYDTNTSEGNAENRKWEKVQKDFDLNVARIGNANVL